MHKTLHEAMAKHGAKCVVAKKGKKYITIAAGELRLTTVQGHAAAFANDDAAMRFFDAAAMDTRNAAVLGKSYRLCPIG